MEVEVVEAILSFSEVVVTLLSNFLELSCAFLRLEEIVINGTESGLLVGVFTSTVVVQILELCDFIIIFLFFFLKALGFIFKVIDLFAKREALVGFLGSISLS